MNKGKKRPAQSKAKKLLSMFLKSAGITLLICIIGVGALAWTYRATMYDGKGTEEDDLGIGKEIDEEKLKDINQTLAVFGVDIDGYRTDVIFLVNVDTKTKKVKVLSIPRDTKVEWTQKEKDKLKELNGKYASVTKINEMTSYAGIENVRDFTISQIQNMLGVKVDNYVVIDIEAFNKIVDAIGGVEVDVPVLDNGKAFYYHDYAQDLHIDLKPGLQVLNGKQAEGLVRFRKGYADGDLGRIKTQKLFLEALAKKVMSPEIITKIPQIAKVVLESVKTDVALTDIPKYYAYLKKLDPTNMSFDIIPGEPQTINGKSYYIPDMDKMEEVVNKVFYDKEPEVLPEATTQPTVDKTVTIEILNGGGIKGEASRAKQQLEADGYIVNNIGNFDGEKQTKTSIFAIDPGRAQQFKAYYPNATIEQKTEMDYDIQIILGTEK